MSNDELTDRQLALRVNRIFVDASKPNRPDHEVEPPKVNGAARWIARALVAEDALAKQANADRLTVDKRMLQALSDDETRIDWTEREWADYLDCSKTAVHDSRTWETVLRLRARSKAVAVEKRIEVTGEKKSGRKKRGKPSP